jgi:hypothetical protein
MLPIQKLFDISSSFTMKEMGTEMFRFVHAFPKSELGNQEDVPVGAPLAICYSVG